MVKTEPRSPSSLPVPMIFSGPMISPGCDIGARCEPWTLLKGFG